MIGLGMLCLGRGFKMCNIVQDLIFYFAILEGYMDFNIY